MDREFADFDEMMNRLFTEAAQNPEKEGVWYYGYQVNVGPDGKPVVREFGNVRPRGEKSLPDGVRKPLVDVSVDEKENTVKIVAEMPGADKESIKVNATEDHVDISSNSGGKPYNAEVPLPCPVVADSADASYTNGILQVVFKRKGPEAPKGVNVKVR